VTDSDTAFVDVVQLGGITIAKTADGGDDTFAYTINGTAFELTTVGGMASTTFTGLRPGTYVVTEVEQDDWGLVGISCTDPSGGTTTSGSSATIALAEAESVTCTFTNTFIPPTDDQVIAAQPPPAAPPEGPPWMLWLLGGAAGAVFLAVFGAISLRRRPLAVPWPRRRGR
jgi:ABC-type branched-subunit amino acid transport system permease subunit